MDELAEFKRDVLESLRQPLEAGHVCVSRARYALEFPADFLLVAAMNPCPCGTRGDGTRRCRCSAQMLRRYFTRLSQPLLDRIDICLWISGLKAGELVHGAGEDPTSLMRERVARAHEMQRQRYGASKLKNSALRTRGIRQFSRLDSASRSLLDSAQDKFHLSNRGVTRVLRVARTIADLESTVEVEESHVAEAISFRNNQFRS